MLTGSKCCNKIHSRLVTFIIVVMLTQTRAMYPQHLANNATISHEFTKAMCRQRTYRMNWREILKPCAGKLGFGAKMYSLNRTNAKRSQIINKQIRKTGDYSGFRIKTYDFYNNSKRIGGDTWRVFLKGPASVEPYVYDLNNGEYDVMFLLLEPGVYKIIVALEGSTCSAFVNPPYDWFEKGDYNGHFQSQWMYKSIQGWPYLINERIWNVLANFYINVLPGEKAKIKNNLQKLSNWQHICGLSKCTFVKDGFGRWINNKWVPYSDAIATPSNHTRKKREKNGVLWIYGDCYAYHFWQAIHNTSLCKKQFQRCMSYNWIYPRWHPDASRDKSIHFQQHYKINISRVVEYLQKVLDKKELNQDNSAMLLNMGLHFIRSASFYEYRKVIDKYIEVIKKHKTKVIWRSTTSIYRAEKKPHKRFQTYQRALLFNAYAMSAMCQAGIPIVDVFPMTSSIPFKPSDGIHYNINIFEPLKKMLQKYLEYL